MPRDPHAEILRLRTALRDLVALSTIPAAWVGREPPAIAAGLADVLVGSLHLDFAFVRLCDPKGGAAVEVTRGNAWKVFPEWLQRHLAVVGQFSRREIIPDVSGGVESCRGVVIPIGVNAEGGLVAAACDRTDFPTEIDQLLLSVAANHAATAFQSARLIHERRRAEEELRQAHNELELKVAERTAALRQATAELQTILDASPVGIALFGKDHTVQRCNPAFEYMLGWTADEIVGRPIPVPATHQEQWSALVQRLNRGEAFAHVETRFLRKDGSEFDAAVACAPLQDEAGRAGGFVGTIMDVTERKRADEERERLLARERAARAEAEAAQQRFRDLVNSVEGIVWEADAETFAFSFVSKQAERILGHPIEHWLGEPTFWQDHLHPDDRDWVIAFCVQATAEKRNHDFEYRMTAADGHIVWLRDLVTVVAEGDRATKLRGVMVDITKRKRAEEALGEQANLLNLTHDSVFVRNRSDVITYWNRGAEERYGWTKEAAVGKVSHQLTQTVFPAPLEEITAELLRTGRWEGELTHMKRDGTQVVVASRWSLQRDEQGNPIAILETNNDITERKRAEEALRRSEAYLAEAQRLSHTGSWAWNVATREAFYWSQEEYHLYGFDPEGGLPPFEVHLQRTHPEDRARHAETLERAIRERTDYEWELRVVLPDGTMKYLHTIGHPVFNAAGELVEYIGTSMDVTERKRAEEALRKSERQFRALFDQAAVGIALVNAAGQVFETNRQLQQQLGYREEEFHYLSVAQVTHPDDLERDWHLFAELLSGQRDYYQLEKRYYRKDGSLVWGNLTVSLVRDERGAPLFGIAIVEDITERKEAEAQLTQVTQELLARNQELWRLQGEMGRVEPLAALGRVTGTIAHELGTPLNSVLGYTQLLAQETLPEGARESLQIIEAQTQRMIEIIQQYLSHTRRALPRHQPLDLNALVRETLVLLKPIFHQGRVQVRTALADGLPFPSGDGASLQRVLINVLTNAVDAMDGGGEVSVTTQLSAGAEQGRGGIVVEVQDTGGGIAPELLPRLFDLFVTTKAPGKGTGLGLAVCQEIIKAHGGTITIASQPREGTCVRLFLPTNAGREAPALVKERA